LIVSDSLASKDTIIDHSLDEFEDSGDTGEGTGSVDRSGIDDKAAAAFAEKQADHMRLLLRICNKSNTPIAEEDRLALLQVLCSLSADQIADLQSRARTLLQPCMLVI
jgi:hypothetical protein